MYAPAKRPRSALDLPDKLLTELALGMDTVEVLATRYGFDEFDLAEVLEQPAVKKALTARQTELEGKGVIFKVKARMLADDLLDDVYTHAKQSRDFREKLDAIKFLSAAGGVATPPPEAGANSGRQVSVNIDLGAAARGQVSIRLDFAEMFPESSADDLRVIEHEEDADGSTGE